MGVTARSEAEGSRVGQTLETPKEVKRELRASAAAGTTQCWNSNGAARSKDSCLQSQNSGSWGRRIPVSSKPFWTLDCNPTFNNFVFKLKTLWLLLSPKRKWKKGEREDRM